MQSPLVDLLNEQITCLRLLVSALQQVRIATYELLCSLRHSGADDLIAPALNKLDRAYEQITQAPAI